MSGGLAHGGHELFGVASAQIELRSADAPVAVRAVRALISTVAAATGLARDIVRDAPAVVAIACETFRAIANDAAPSAATVAVADRRAKRRLND